MIGMIVFLVYFICWLVAGLLIDFVMRPKEDVKTRIKGALFGPLNFFL
jgi:hypothetical protein